MNQIVVWLNIAVKQNRPVHKHIKPALSIHYSEHNDESESEI